MSCSGAICALLCIARLAAAWPSPTMVVLSELSALGLRAAQC
jgi:hypothetical protein